MIAAGARQSLIDTIYGLNDSHLGKKAVTFYEALGGRRADSRGGEHHLLPGSASSTVRPFPS